MGNKVKMETSVCLGLAKAAPWALGFLAPNTFLCLLFLLTFHSSPSHSSNCTVGRTGRTLAFPLLTAAL